VGHRADRDHFRRVARTGDGSVSVRAIVSGRADDDDTGVRQELDGLHEWVGRYGFLDLVTERQVGHLDVVNVLIGKDPVQPGDDVGGAALAVLVEHSK
jgi:hypothetical protein